MRPVAAIVFKDIAIEYKNKESFSSMLLFGLLVVVVFSFAFEGQNRKDMAKTDPNIWVKPSELAKAMLFLASDEASAITGALLPVTGRV